MECHLFVGIKGRVALREFLTLLTRFDLKGLFIEPTSNLAIQVFRSLFVGGLAFVADAGSLWLISITGLHYLLCSVFGFIVGVTVNYLLSVRFVFKEKASVGRFGEITVYFIVSVIGLGLTVLLMWLFTDILGFYFMVSKVFATVITFFWNFSSRKLLLYRKSV